MNIQELHFLRLIEWQFSVPQTLYNQYFAELLLFAEREALLPKVFRASSSSDESRTSMVVPSTACFSPRCLKPVPAYMPRGLLLSAVDPAAPPTLQSLDPATATGPHKSYALAAATSSSSASDRPHAVPAPPLKPFHAPPRVPSSQSSSSSFPPFASPLLRSLPNHNLLPGGTSPAHSDVHYVLPQALPRGVLSSLSAPTAAGVTVQSQQTVSAFPDCCSVPPLPPDANADGPPSLRPPPSKSAHHRPSLQNHLARARKRRLGRRQRRHVKSKEHTHSHLPFAHPYAVPNVHTHSHAHFHDHGHSQSAYSSGSVSFSSTSTGCSASFLFGATCPMDASGSAETTSCSSSVPSQHSAVSSRAATCSDAALLQPLLPDQSQAAALDLPRVPSLSNLANALQDTNLNAGDTAAGAFALPPFSSYAAVEMLPFQTSASALSAYPSVMPTDHDHDHDGSAFEHTCTFVFAPTPTPHSEISDLSARSSTIGDRTPDSPAALSDCLYEVDEREEQDEALAEDSSSYHQQQAVRASRVEDEEVEGSLLSTPQQQQVQSVTTRTASCHNPHAHARSTYRMDVDGGTTPSVEASPALLFADSVHSSSDREAPGGIIISPGRLLTAPAVSCLQLQSNFISLDGFAGAHSGHGQSVIVNGGATMAGSALNSGKWSHAHPHPHPLLPQASPPRACEPVLFCADVPRDRDRFATCSCTASVKRALVSTTSTGSSSSSSPSTRAVEMAMGAPVAACASSRVHMRCRCRAQLSVVTHPPTRCECDVLPQLPVVPVPAAATET